MIIQNLSPCQCSPVQASILWRCILDVWERSAGAKQEHIHMFFGVSADIVTLFWVNIHPLVTGLMVANIFSNRASCQSLLIQEGFRSVSHFLFSLCWNIISLLLYLNSNVIFRTELKNVLTNRKHFLFSAVSLCSQKKLEGQFPVSTANFYNLGVAGHFPVCHSGL